MIFNIQEAVVDREVMEKCGQWQHICQELPVLQADRWAFQHVPSPEQPGIWHERGEKSQRVKTCPRGTGHQSAPAVNGGSKKLFDRFLQRDWQELGWMEPK